MNKPHAKENAHFHQYGRGHCSKKPFSCVAILNSRRMGKMQDKKVKNSNFDNLKKKLKEET